MISRGALIAVLFVVELAVLGEMGVAIRGGEPAPWSGPRSSAEAASGPGLVEDGPHKIFDAAAHPALSVDIGYADLTIVTRNVSQIDVAVSKSTDFGFFRAKAPITAREDGESIRISTSDGPGWSTGDDRMVTVVVPPQTQVTVVKAGDVVASGLRGEASLTSVGGGTITVEDYNGPALRVTSSDGLILLQQVVAARLDAKSRNDRIEGTGLQVRDGTVQADDRVTLGFAAGADTLVSAETNDGKINLAGFDPASSVAAAHKSGDDNDDSSSQTVRVGAGEGSLVVHSSDGNIDLTKEG
jgi:hypothetical protein